MQKIVAAKNVDDAKLKSGIPKEQITGCVKQSDTESRRSLSNYIVFYKV